MNLAKALGLDLRAAAPGRGTIVAFVGAGGKTSALFALAEEALRSSGPAPVIVTTTTHIADPRREWGRPPLRVVVAPQLAVETVMDGESPVAAAIRGGAQNDAPKSDGELVVVASGEIQPDPGKASPAKLVGVHPSRCAELAAQRGLLLVEADGSRGRPVKAPSGREPAVPALCDIVVGVVGLDCLGSPLDVASAHRPEILGPLVGCPPGRRIEPRHIDALVRAPDGLFKGAPPDARRILLLNKAEVGDAGAIREILALLGAAGEAERPCDRVLVCSLEREEILDVIELRRSSDAERGRSFQP